MGLLDDQLLSAYIGWPEMARLGIGGQQQEQPGGPDYWRWYYSQGPGAQQQPAATPAPAPQGAQPAASSPTAPATPAGAPNQPAATPAPSSAPPGCPQPEMPPGYKATWNGTTWKVEPTTPAAATPAATPTPAPAPAPPPPASNPQQSPQPDAQGNIGMHKGPGMQGQPPPAMVSAQMGGTPPPQGPSQPYNGQPQPGAPGYHRYPTNLEGGVQWFMGNPNARQGWAAEHPQNPEGVYDVFRPLWR